MGTSQQIQKLLRHFNSTQHNLKLHIKSPVISPVLDSNMKAFTMLSLIFVVVAIVMIAKATDYDIGSCEPWAEQIRKCQDGSEADSTACCENQGVPYECSGLCEV